ncbi:MAG: YkgJ family cysteine cluster protein [Polyangiaceae bacterium]|nr:YkgJ family cysteine cluster protein [Polyangiaceae bacterium]
MTVKRRYDDLKLHLAVLGEEHEISVKTRVWPTAVVEIIETARAITDGFTSIAAANAERAALKVSCKKGCTACCYQTVPVAPIEALHLAQVVDAMPEGRRSIVKSRFEAALAKLKELGLWRPEPRAGKWALRSTATTVHEQWEDISRRYFEAVIPCPFLEEGACSIYADRPSPCREYAVTSAPEECTKLSTEVRTIARPVHMGEVLTALSNEELGRDDKQIPLVLALAWARENGRSLQQKKDGEHLAMALVEQIQAADRSE